MRVDLRVGAPNAAAVISQVAAHEEVRVLGTMAAGNCDVALVRVRSFLGYCNLLFAGRRTLAQGSASQAAESARLQGLFGASDSDDAEEEEEEEEEEEPDFSSLSGADPPKATPSSRMSASATDPQVGMGRVERALANAEPPVELLDPITLELMLEPVTCCSGSTFEQASIQEWWRQGRQTDPVSNARLKSTELIPNNFVRSAVHAWIDNNQQPAEQAQAQAVASAAAAAVSAAASASMTFEVTCGGVTHNLRLATPSYNKLLTKLVAAFKLPAADAIQIITFEDQRSSQVRELSSFELCGTHVAISATRFRCSNGPALLAAGAAPHGAGR